MTLELTHHEPHVVEATASQRSHPRLQRLLRLRAENVRSVFDEIYVEAVLFRLCFSQLDDTSLEDDEPEQVPASFLEVEQQISFENEPSSLECFVYWGRVEDCVNLMGVKDLSEFEPEESDYYAKFLLFLEKFSYFSF